MSETLKELEAKAESLKARFEKAAAELKEIESHKLSTVVGNKSTSLENQTLRAFGCSHPSQLINLNTASAKYAHVPAEFKAAVKRLKETVDTSRMIAQMNGGAKDRMGSDDIVPANLKNITESRYAKEELIPLAKSFGSGTPGSGQEWLATAVSSNFIEEYELERRLEGSMRQMPMPTSPFTVPVQSSVTEARLAAEKAQISDANFGTDSLILSAKKFGEFYCLPEELNEDSAPAILEVARREVIEAQERAIETALLNGDDSATHMDTDTAAGAADLAAKGWKGLRKLALDNAAAATVDYGGGISATKLDEQRKLMGRFGINVRELAWLVSPSGYQQMQALDEVSTVEKFGPQATILNGALSAYRGIPIIVSEYVRDDLAASGVNTAPTDDKTAVYLVNLRRFWIGIRRPIRVRLMQDLADYDRYLVSSYQRKAFEGITQSASEVSVSLGINVSS